MKAEILNKKDLSSQADAVIYFLQRLDIEMVNDILEDNRTYQDFEKAIFIHKLGDAFDEFIKFGDAFLNCYSGSCNSKLCNYKCRGFSFIGNHSGNYLDMIIEIKEGIVQDMYECSEFKMYGPSVTKNERVKIQTSHFPD